MTMSLDEFEEAYYDLLGVVGAKLLEWFPKTQNNDEFLYALMLAKFCDPDYIEEIRGVWNPVKQEKLLRDAIAALKKLQNGLHPEISNFLTHNGTQMPYAHNLERALEHKLPNLKRGKIKRGNFNRRAASITECCVDAWEYLGKQKSPKTISETSRIAEFIQDIFHILNESSNVRAAYRALKNTQELRKIH